MLPEQSVGSDSAGRAGLWTMGSLIEVVGLHAASGAAFNGRRARVVGVDDLNRRYEACFADDGTLLKVRHSNARCCGWKAGGVQMPSPPRARCAASDVFCGPGGGERPTGAAKPGPLR